MVIVSPACQLEFIIYCWYCMFLVIVVLTLVVSKSFVGALSCLTFCEDNQYITLFDLSYLFHYDDLWLSAHYCCACVCLLLLIIYKLKRLLVIRFICVAVLLSVTKPPFVADSICSLFYWGRLATSQFNNKLILITNIHILFLQALNQCRQLYYFIWFIRNLILDY